MSRTTKPAKTKKGSIAPSKTVLEAAERMTPVLEAKVAKAFAFWKKNPYTMMVDLCLKFEVGQESVRAYIVKHKLQRPDGRDYTKKSSRQEWIAKGYKKAAKEGWHAAAAALWVEKQSGHHCGRGDIQYWAMKNDLTYLPEAANMAKKTNGAVDAAA